MDSTAYNKVITYLSQQVFDIAPFLEKSVGEEQLPRLALAYKKETMSIEERDVSASYLQLGFFNELDEEDRLAYFCMVLEAEYIRELNRNKKDCSQKGRGWRRCSMWGVSRRVNNMWYEILSPLRGSE